MNNLEEIKRLQTSGKSDEEISEILKAKGLDENDIDRDISHSQIRQAVDQEENNMPITEKMPEEMKGMQPSILASENAPPQHQDTEQYAEQAPAATAAPESYQDYSNYSQTQQPQQYQDQQQYAQYQPTGISTDTITEIADQIVTEKTSSLQNEIERMKEIGNAIESKMEYLDERLKKIEKIIDRLQLSILQKVGEYVNNVDDIKKELIETQKSFKSLLPKQESKKELI